MNRLTTNKETPEMNMIELAYNSCYAKDGKARCRDYETDIDARELAIKLLEKYADIPNEFTCDDDFDDFMLDSLQYGTDTILGLIAVFYRNLWAMADLRERMKEYEDLEEQGKLLKLPCKVGDRIWTFEEYSEGELTGEVVDFKVGKIEIAFDYEQKPYFLIDNMDFPLDCLGKTLFHSKSEAESVLQKMNEMEGK